MAKELSNILASIDKVVTKEEKEYKKERVDARTFVLALADKLDPIRRKRLSDLDVASQTSILEAMQTADKLLLAACGRRVFEDRRGTDGERLDKFVEPIESNRVWAFIERLKRQCAVIDENGEIIAPPPRRVRTSTTQIPTEFQQDTGEKLGDVAVVVEKKPKTRRKAAAKK